MHLRRSLSITSLLLAGCLVEVNHGEPPGSGESCGGEECAPGFSCLNDECVEDSAPTFRSCAEILADDPDAANQEYVLLLEDGSSTTVFCEMQRFSGGWTRIANFEAAASASCPGDWQRQEDPAGCTRNIVDVGGARSALFSSPHSYSEVMGYVRGYQFSSMDGFAPSPANVEDGYVDGVSITVGPEGAREHVWTYAVGWSDDDLSEQGGCPCVGGALPPDFVGQDFSCESGATGSPIGGSWFTEDPLWDGDGTGSNCDTDDDPSYFSKNLGSTGSRDIEVRLLADQPSTNEDVGVYELELYVR